MNKDILLDFIVPISVGFGMVFVGLVLRRLIYHQLHRWAKRTHTDLDDVIISSIRFPSFLWIILIGIYLAIRISKLPANVVNCIYTILNCLIILSVTLVLANLSTKLLRYQISKGKIDIPATGIIQTLTKGIILIVGTLILLYSLGINVTPILATLGVGGLAVALALQDTLSNLFSGMHILIDKPLRVGDYIKLDSGEEGYVVDIGWRTTKIRMLPNNIVIIPNSKLSQSVITNFNMPEKMLSVYIPVGVSYDSDPQQVEDILIEEAIKGADEIKGLRKDPPPIVRFKEFGDCSLNFLLIVRVEEFIDQYLVEHELRKRIFKRFQKEGIEIPFPIRTVYMRKESE